MAISGHIILEDIVLSYVADRNLMVTYTVTDVISGNSESRTVHQAAFFKALAIMVHSDGMPSYEEDYHAAEEVQPENKALRFIP